MRRLILIIAALAATLVSAQQAPQRMEVSLRLFNAVFDAPPQPADGPALLMETARVPDPQAEGGARWERVWGVVRDYCSSNSQGRVTAGEVSEIHIRLGIEIQIGDPWIPGGRARYQLDLERQPGRGAAPGAERLLGTYRGSYRGIAISGKVDGEIKPPRPAPSADCVPVQPGEHPRILFRRQELGRLQALAETPFGRGCVAAMQGPVGDGMRYQLTGNGQYAESAMTQCLALMAQGVDNRPGNGWAARVEQLALAYDLCYDAWPSDVRRRVEKHLQWAGENILSEQVSIGNGLLWHVGASSSASLLASAGFAGLALWGEPGLAPARPISPSEADRIAPADEYTPGNSVPVVPLQSGASPDAWLALPPLDYAVDGDPLLELGGVEHARPEMGTQLIWGGEPTAFAPLDDQYIMPNGGIYLSTYQTYSDSTMAFYCVLQNDRRRTVRVVNPQTRTGRPLMVLNGNVLNDGLVVEIDKGLYPLLVVGRFTAKWAALKPMLVDATLEDIENARDELARRQAEYRQAYQDWQDDYAEWERYGGADVRYLKLFAQSRMMCYLYAREAADTDELQSEKDYYRGIACETQAGYASAYRLMFGEDLSPYHDIAYAVPRKLFAHYLPGDALPVDARGNLQVTDVPLDINGDPAIGGATIPRAFPGIPEVYKPAVLWLWNRRAGITGRATPDKAPSRALLQNDPVRTFVSYPFDLEPRHPREVMPLAWEAPVFGQYAFRNSWAGRDDIIVQTFGKSHIIGGWNAPNAGTFRIFGYGKVWAGGPHGAERWRFQENVVQLPDDPINALGLGAVAYAKTEADGSGVVTYDMDEVYAGRKANFLGQDIERMYDRYGGGRTPDALVDLGIRGKRAFGVDYSGKSGAPCLFVVVDDITGGKTKLWSWQQEPGMTAGARDFTIAQGDAVLKGTFVTVPSSLKLDARPANVQSALSRFTRLDFANEGLYAAGDNFFVVCTLGKGTPPAVQVTGTGLQAVVTVGGRTVRYDGEKVVFGDVR